MAEKKPKVTLIGSELAHSGIEFVYMGSAPDCAGCSVARACNNLKVGRRYRIVGIRTTRHSCSVHHNGACAVEVVESPLPALVSADMAIRNSRIRYEPPCSREECKSFPLCQPDGIVGGEAYVVSSVMGNSEDPCERGWMLKRVVLTPV
jgi:hypothetical protein